MKRSLFLLILMSFFLAIATPSIFAGDFEYIDDLYVKGGKIIAKYTGTAANVTIPYYDDSVVVGIGRNAFSGNRTITRVSFEGGIRTIGENAFSNCNNLTEINLPATLTRIGSGAFSGCTKLRQIIIPESVIEWGDEVFSRSGLTTIVISKNIKEIPYGMFINTPLEQIIIPEGVVRIGAETFTGCTNLKAVVLPSTIQSIGGFIISWDRNPEAGGASYGGAFENCTSLTTITISNSVKQMQFINRAEWDKDYGVDNFKNCPNISQGTKELLKNLGYNGGF